MMSRRTVCTPVVLSLAITCAMGIMLLGGCPQQQVPSTPTTQEPNSTTSPTDTPDVEPERPIPGPVIDANEPGTGGDGGSDGTSGGDGGNDGTGGSGGTGTATFSLRFDAPLTAVAVRPTAKVNLSFRLTDRDSIVTQVEFVLARDDNEDGKPDGNPVVTKAITSTTSSGKYEFSAADAPLSSAGLGRFLLGLRVTPSTGDVQTTYASGRLTVDAVAPTATWVSPTANALTSPKNWEVKLLTSDNSSHTVRVLLDDDTNPNNGYAGILVPDTKEPANDAANPNGVVRTFKPLLSISSGTYYYYAVVTDGIDPPTAFYAPPTAPIQLSVTNRIIGRYELNQLDPNSPDPAAPYDNFGAKSKGAILQGFNFNDLAGASMTSVPDLNDDGADELIIASRFGKPRVVEQSGVGWGEAYLVLGQNSRLRDVNRLNSVGVLTAGGIPGLVFTGIRTPRTTSWSEGLSDVTAVPDMDADGKPDLVFSFPRAESISLGNETWQYPALHPYAPGMGSLEYDPRWDFVDTIDLPVGETGYSVTRADFIVPLEGRSWLKNRTQFTRGGIVIVSSTNRMFSGETVLSRKGDRIIDLHEAGQCFSDMRRDTVYPLLQGDFPDPNALAVPDPNCPDSEWELHDFGWDLVFAGQGPAGFSNWVTDPLWWDPANPPLANMRAGYSISGVNANYMLPINDKCDDKCVVLNHWLDPSPCEWQYTINASVASAGLLRGSQVFPTPLDPNQDTGFHIHSGFCGLGSAEVSPWDTTVGARVLGQRVEDHFGTAVSADDTWLYISAPQHSALQKDVPDLGSELVRERAGVVYQYRIKTPAYFGGPTRSQLWIEPGTRSILDPNNNQADPNDPNTFIEIARTWPYVDAERSDLIDPYDDYSMPVPHTYVIQEFGSDRANDTFWELEWARLFPGGSPAYQPGIRTVTYPMEADDCASDRLLVSGVTGGVRGVAPCSSTHWMTSGVGSSLWWITQAVQIVGPHANANIANVRALGDVDGDTVGDFAVGSPDVLSDIAAGTGTAVGAVFIVYGRPTGLEGDYLLECMAYEPDNVKRLSGVIIKGNDSSEPVGRVFDAVGDFNGDGFRDVIIGGERGSGGAGEAIVVFGDDFLQSPAGGWTVDAALLAGVAMRFSGEAPDDLAGANVSGAGDVDADGLADVLIAAPNAEGGRGAVYLVYGSPLWLGGRAVSLSKIGTFDLPGAKFIGRAVGDKLGGGSQVYGDGVPGNPNGLTYLNPDENPVAVNSRGILGIGDLDGDGKADFALSSMLASPRTRRNAGEVYIIYGSGD